MRKFTKTSSLLLTAVIVAASALQGSSSSVTALYNKGVAALEEGDPHSASAWFERAAAINPREPRILLGLATAYFEEGQARLAQQRAGQLLALPNLDFSTLMAAGRLLARYGSIAQAIEAFQLARKRAPPVIEGEKSSLYFNRLLAALDEQSRKSEEAVENLQMLVREQPDNPDNYYRLTLMLAKVGHFSQAYDIARAADEKFPQSPETVLSYALACYFSGHNDKAEDAYHRLIKLESGSAQSYFALGNFYEDTKRLDDAASAFRLAVVKDPHNYLNQYMYGVSLFQLDKLQEARAALEKALALNPRHADSYYWLGRIDVRQGKETMALKDFKSVIQYQPNHNSAYYQLGLLYARMGDKEDSQKMFQIQQHLNAQAHEGIVAERMP